MALRHGASGSWAVLIFNWRRQVTSKSKTFSGLLYFVANLGSNRTRHASMSKSSGLLGYSINALGYFFQIQFTYCDFRSKNSFILAPCPARLLLLSNCNDVHHEIIKT